MVSLLVTSYYMSYMNACILHIHILCMVYITKGKLETRPIMYVTGNK